jgi:hypothetical protein
MTLKVTRQISSFARSAAYLDLDLTDGVNLLLDITLMDFYV